MATMLHCILFATLACYAYAQEGVDRRVFYNGTGVVFFKAQEPLQLTVNNRTFTLEKILEAQGATDNDTATLSLKFGNAISEVDTLSSATVEFSFSRSVGYWRVTGTTLSVDGQVGGSPVSKKDFAVTGNKIEVPKMYSYHCSRVLKYANKNDTSLYMLVKGIQVQPFDIVNNRFDDGYDCEGFFTVSIWAGIFITLLMGILLGWGINMLLSVATPDQFDDPKGKPLVVNAQE